MNLGKIGTTDVILFGRTIKKENYVGFSWSATGFSIEFEGSSLYIEYLADGETNERNKPYFGVIIDEGEVSLRFETIQRDWNKVVLAENLTCKKHKVTIIKLTESSKAPVFFRNLATDGIFFSPKIEMLPKIEIIGDSISCGYGIECPEPDGEFNTYNQNVTKAFGYLIAKKLHSDLTIIAHSGWAIFKSPYGGSMAECYDKMDSIAGYDELYDFSYNPDVLIIALGTNDSAWIGNQQEMRISEFKKYYIEFLKRLRSIYPNTPIICAVGMVSIINEPANREAVNEAKALGVANLHYCKLPVSATLCAQHPCAQCHEEAAEVLIKAILSVSDKFKKYKYD